jgi:hypothetical protein
MIIGRARFGAAKVAVVVGILLVAFGATFFGFKIVGEAAERGRAEEAAKVAAEREKEVKRGIEVEGAIRAADKLAASYDYDGATMKIREFGGGEAELAAAIAKYEGLRAKTVRYADTTKIPHVFFHSLIVDSERAFRSSSSGGYNQYMATVEEFRKILDELYKRDFVLVNITDVAREVEGKFTQGEIFLPAGKKPIVMSQDDVNYYKYMTGDGFARKLVVRDGELVEEYVEADGKVVYGEYDMVSILEKFIGEHPDFSYRGARAILALTGYEGVLGYRTQAGAEERESEVAAARPVVAALKEKGWVFASHSWGHIAMRDVSVARVVTDSDKWEAEVKPVVGETEIFIYPHGQDLAGVGAYSGEKYETLRAKGFRYFCNVDGSSPYWVQIREDYVRQGRRNIDGYRMYYNPGLLDDLFVVSEVWDSARPTPVPAI